MAKGASDRGLTVWFAVHRRELVSQTSETFRDAGLNHGIIAAGSVFIPRMKVYVVMIGSVARRLDSLKKPDIIIWDECHHLSAATYRKVYEWAAGATHIGLSATPWRLDSSGLGDFFEVMVCGMPPAQLIANGYLSPYRLFGTPNEPDTSKLHHIGGDFNKKEVVELMDRPQVVGDAIDHYVRHALGRCALLFDVSVSSSEKQAEAFRARGIPALHVDAKTDDITRRRAIKDLANGELKILTNVDLFGEGVSVNNVSCVIQKRPTESLSLHLQQIGRGLRMYPGKKDCIILDHAGNWRRHGLPDDHREWTLDGSRESAKQKPAAPVRQCERCFAAYLSSSNTCPECGWRGAACVREVEKVDGQLAEIEIESAREIAREAAERKISQGRARSLADLMRLGHSESRARHIIAARDEKDALRDQVRELAHAAGVRIPHGELMAMKPKQLRQTIESFQHIRPEAAEHEPERAIP